MNETATSKSGTLIGALFVLALLAGLSYWVVSRMTDPSAPAIIAWKGLGVGLLAIWAFLQARNFDGWLIGVVLALGAAGDVALDLAGANAGGVFFMAGHVVAVFLYSRNRRFAMSFSQKLLALLLVPIVIWLGWALPADRRIAIDIAIYATPLAFMAATAWISRFPRYWTGLGAMLFVISDLLIFARMGPLAGSMIPGLLIWPLYFTGQAMIAIGVVRTLEEDRLRGAVPPPIEEPELV
ncbi:lysoplasmalogenase [Parasphingopyxis marina]|uniref:Lysoplasmalogenase n=1 Tax=Parasphingopyxis marina TaxID=2761622 RepID=A0A842HZH7_9SPHN|nr:lysoplasmalogenase [Parasphingopyxis marina]MBC2777779.1 lysoplasmalogenase [Parasphingopyxis marina]